MSLHIRVLAKVQNKPVHSVWRQPHISMQPYCIFDTMFQICDASFIQNLVDSKLTLPCVLTFVFIMLGSAFAFISASAIS